MVVLTEVLLMFSLRSYKLHNLDMMSLIHVLNLYITFSVTYDTYALAANDSALMLNELRGFVELLLYNGVVGILILGIQTFKDFL